MRQRLRMGNGPHYVYNVQCAKGYPSRPRMALSPRSVKSLLGLSVKHCVKITWEVKPGFMIAKFVLVHVI